MLRPAEWNAILRVLDTHRASIYVTGSQIDGTAVEGSDIDVVAVDPSAEDVQFHSFEPDGRRVDLQVVPATGLLRRLSDPHPKPDRVPFTKAECAVLNAVAHGIRLCYPTLEDPIANIDLDRAATIMAEVQLEITGATLKGLRRRLHAQDGWGLLSVARIVADRWADAWLATRLHFVGSVKWRLRFLRHKWPDLYLYYLAVQFPVAFIPGEDAPVAQAIEKLVQFILACPFRGTPVEKEALEVAQEVVDVLDCVRA